MSAFRRTVGNDICLSAVVLTGTPGDLTSFDYLGLHRYSLTYCTIQRRKTFTKQEVVTLVLAQISRAAAEHRFDIIAYCFMPDHLHLLVEGTADNSNCKQLIARLKQSRGTTTRRPITGNGGSGTASSTCCATTRSRWSSRSTFSRIRSGRGWWSASRITRSLDRWSIRRRNFWKRSRLRPAEAGHYRCQEVRMKPNTADGKG